MNTSNKSSKKTIPFMVLAGAVFFSGLGLGGYSGVVEASAQSSRTTKNTTNTLKQPKIKDMYVVKQTANVRAKASKSSKVVEWAVKGSVVEGLGQSGKWIKVKQDGKIGYISSKVLSPIGVFEVDRYQYVHATSMLSGYKEVSEGVYVAYYQKKPLITVTFHNESADHATMKIDYMAINELEKTNSDGLKLLSFIDKKVEMFIASQFGKKTPDSKLFNKKLNEIDYSESSVNHFTVGQKKVMIDQSKLPYEIELTVTPKEESVKMTAKKWLEATKNSSFIKDPNQVKSFTYLKQGTVLQKVGETNTMFYVKYNGKYGYVKKTFFKNAELKLSKNTSSRSEMNASFGKIMTKQNENRYVLKDGKKEVAVVEFQSKESIHPVLKIKGDDLYYLPLNSYHLDENKAKSEKEMYQPERTTPADEVELTEGYINVKTVDDPYSMFTKEEIVKAKKLKKQLDPVIKAYAEVQFGKNTKEAKKLYNLFYDQDFTLYMKANGQNHYFKPADLDNLNDFVKMYFE